MYLDLSAEGVSPTTALASPSLKRINSAIFIALSLLGAKIIVCHSLTSEAFKAAVTILLFLRLSSPSFFKTD